MHFNTMDLSGETFGRLTVLNKAANVSGRVAWECQCECGRRCIAIAHLLRSGGTRSCGCLRVETSTNRMTAHGYAKKGAVAPEHKVWTGMLKRCDEKNSDRYERYAGRGITVCDRWRNFQNFIDDMGPRPSPKHSIDRINNDGNYEPGNCRWATQREQVENSTTAKIFTVDGRSQSISAWAREVGVNATTISSRLKRGLPFEQAIIKRGEKRIYPPRLRRLKAA